jgi:hypothetical protein
MDTETKPTLLALRQSIKSGSNITYATMIHPPRLIISHHPLPQGHSHQIPPQRSDTLNCPGVKYMKQAREYRLTVGFASVTQRKHVVDWLEEKVQESDWIAPLACAYIIFIRL